MLDHFFFGQHLDEEEILHHTLHKHWMIGLKELWLPTLLFGLLVMLLAVLPDPYVFYIVALLLLGIAIWWIRNFFNYYIDAWLITNKGVIDLQWHGWFHRSVSKILYSDIEAIDYEVKGIWMTILNIGTVSIEKISTGTNLSMPYVKRPKYITRLLSELCEKYVYNKNLKDAKTVQTILAEFIAGNMQAQSFEGASEEEENENEDEESDERNPDDDV